MIRSCALLLLLLDVASGCAGATGSRVERAEPQAFGRLPKLGASIIELGGGHKAPGPRHEAAVRHLRVSPDDRWLVSSGDDGLVLRWSLEEPQTVPIVLFDGHDEQPRQLALSPDGKLVAMTMGDEPGVRLVSIEGGPPLFQTNDGAPATAVAFDGEKKLWVATSSGYVALYDVAEKEAIWRAPVAPGREIGDSTEYDALFGHGFVVFRPHAIRSSESRGSSLAFTLPGGRPAATLDISLQCVPLRQVEILCPGSVRTKPDADPRIVLRFLDLKTGQVRLLEAPEPIEALSPNHDNSAIALATVSSEKSPNMAVKPSLVVVDTVRGEPRATRALPERAVSVAMTRSGHVLVGHASGAIRMLEP